MRFAICNEIYKDWPFHQACKSIRDAGYTGIEIAPFTLSEDPASIPATLRRQYRDIIRSEGLRFAGLHWLMMTPPGLHVTTPDSALYERSWGYVRNLIDLCADLGDGGVMVFGSPKQRSATGGIAAAGAASRFEAGLAGVAQHALERDVSILIEALSPAQTDVVTSLEEAASMAERIASPAIRTMFDTHNAVDETESHAGLVDRYFKLIRHVHVNEMDGRHPGTGDYDFKPVLSVLAQRGYQGWVSLEVFDFSAGAENIARESIAYLQAQSVEAAA
jgi:sugar phosphate isomerase/epimerase